LQEKFSRQMRKALAIAFNPFPCEGAVCTDCKKLHPEGH